MLTVTRWFGGTLLGTGGLVKAYTEAAKAVVAETEPVELVETRSFRLGLGYDLYERAKRLLEALGAEIGEERFATDVELEGRVRSDRVDRNNFV